MGITQEQIAELGTLIEHGHKGPYTSDVSDNGVPYVRCQLPSAPAWWLGCDMEMATGTDLTTGDLMAAAVNALPDLRTELTRLWAVESKAKALIEVHDAVLVALRKGDVDEFDALQEDHRCVLYALRSALEATPPD